VFSVYVDLSCLTNALCLLSASRRMLRWNVLIEPRGQRGGCEFILRRGMSCLPPQYNQVGWGRVLLTEIPLPRTTRKRPTQICFSFQQRRQTRRARIDTLELDEGLPAVSPPSQMQPLRRPGLRLSLVGDGLVGRRGHGRRSLLGMTVTSVEATHSTGISRVAYRLPQGN